MVNELLGKVAIVTGGASGIGAGIVERFLAEGARVVIADVVRDRGEELAAKLGGEVDLLAWPTSPTPIRSARWWRSAVETFGGLDVMVNNAGISSKMHRSFLDDDLADFHRVMSVNVLGVMAGTRDAARQMAKSGWRVDHQPVVDRRHPGRRRGDDVSRIQGGGHHVHPVVGN